MAVNPQLIQFAFAGGVDQSQRDEVQDPAAAFLNLENVRQTKRGGADKRWGFTALPSTRFAGNARSGGYKLLTDDKTVIVVNGPDADIYDVTLGKWQTCGRWCEVGYRVTDLPSANEYISDTEICNGHIAIVSVDTASNVWISVMELATRAFINPTGAPGQFKLQTDGAFPVIGSYGGRYFVAVCGTNSSHAVTAYFFDTHDPGGGWTSIASVALAASGYAVGISCVSLSDRVAVAYVTSSGTDRVTVKTVNISGVLETATIPTTSTTPVAVDVNAYPSDVNKILWVAWNEADAVKMKALTWDSLATVQGTTTTIITAPTSALLASTKIAVSATSGHGRLLVGDTATSPSTATVMRGFKITSGTVGTDGSAITVYNVRPIGRPMTYGGRYYSLFFSGGNILADQATTPICDFTDDVPYVRPVVNASPGLVSLGTIYGKFSVGSDTTKRYIGVGVTRSQAAAVGQLIEVDFADTRRWQSVRHGSSTFLTGAVTTYFDGVRAQEAGFLYAPTKPTATLSGTGVTLTNGRRYVAVYEDVDADGNWVVSGVSVPSATPTPVTDKTITVATAPLTVSYRAAGPSLRVTFYATLDANDGQPPYYRLGSALNDTSASSVSITDTTTDSTLAARAKLYAPDLPGANGESLDRRAPPGLMHLVSYNGMLVGAVGSDVFYSGQLVSGEAPWFDPVFQLPVEGPGDITGIFAQDGTLYLLKRTNIYAVSGDPPADNGASGGLGQPRRIAADIGCIDARSLCCTAVGTFFQSTRGLELLTRAQEVKWIGEAVRDTVDSFPICTSAVLDADAQRVYFTMAASESANQVSGNGRRLVFNLALQTWESIDRHRSASAADAPAQSACVIYTGTTYRYAWLGTDGAVYVEDQSTYLDPGSVWVSKAAESAWVKSAGIQGMQHVNQVLFLAKNLTGHDLNLSLAYDYASSYKTAATWSRATLDALTALIPNEQLKHDCHDDARCESFRVKLTDSTPSSGSVGTGRGAVWVGLTVEVAPQPHAYQLPDASG